MKLSSKLSLAAAALILSGGLALAVLGTRPPPEPKFKGRLIDLLPTEQELPGWSVQHLPIADTPEMQRAVDEALNFDDGVFATYTNNLVRVSIYIAHWRPGKMPHRLIAGHTPDVCWVKAGWETQRWWTSGDLHLGSTSLLPGECRTMTRNGMTEHVVFWHIADEKVVNYATGWRPPWHAMVTDALAGGLAQREEQFFVRISSNVPLSDFWAAKPVQIIAHRLDGLHLKP